MRDDALLYGWARLADGIWRSEKVFVAVSPDPTARLGRRRTAREPIPPRVRVSSPNLDEA
jgi:hypothetical protein